MIDNKKLFITNVTHIIVVIIQNVTRFVVIQKEYVHPSAYIKAKKKTRIINSFL